MIGVIANSSDRAVISEFFELFKTPWEFYRSDRRYEVVLCGANQGLGNYAAKLVLLYAGQEVSADAEENIEVASKGSVSLFSYKGAGIPIYGDFLTFREEGAGLLVDEKSQQAAIHQRRSEGGAVARIGYNLFDEIRTLLTAGQPAAYASMPTLELHIALLRELIVASGVSLVEVPPIPNGYRFIACLTHDVDHPSIVQHKWDHTVFGFLYRAIFGSLNNLFRGRIPFRNLLTNGAAVLKLPFVYIGFANDFWAGFEESYRKMEEGLCSTFFVIPFKNRPGNDSQGMAPKFRASRYGARDIAGAIKKILAAGCEVGLHGIDAWADSSKGLEEFEEIRRLTGISETGVRMHWLYFDQQSPEALEQVGADYDSSIGYRETVGYRNGTTQAYKPLQVERLLELPMHVMDTALFYPAYMDLSQRKATTILRRLTDNVNHFGGCITINWHDRSLAPERLWGPCYRNLVQDLKDRNTWFATCGQAVSWFRKRRSVVFDMDDEGNVVFAKLTAHPEDFAPGLRLRVYNQREISESNGHCSEQYVDIAFNESVDNRVLYGTGR